MFLNDMILLPIIFALCYNGIFHEFFDQIFQGPQGPQGKLNNRY